MKKRAVLHHMSFIVSILIGCQPVDNKSNKNDAYVVADSCYSKFSSFTYPQNLNEDTLLICNATARNGEYRWFNSNLDVHDSNFATSKLGNPRFHFDKARGFVSIRLTRTGLSKFLSNQRDSITLSLTMRYYDGDYGLISFDRITKILLDNREQMTLCFKRNSDFSNFSAESVTKIYVLDEELMPVYCISRNERNEIACRRFYYDEKRPELYSELLDLSVIMGNKPFSDLTYRDILQTIKYIEAGKAISTGVLESHLSGYFKKIPLWTEN